MSEWDWELTDTARRDFDSPHEYARDRITSKLDEIATDQWREPPEYLEPLEGAPHDKLRIGPFRLGCRADVEVAFHFVAAVSSSVPDFNFAGEHRLQVRAVELGVFHGVAKDVANELAAAVVAELSPGAVDVVEEGLGHPDVHRGLLG